MTVETREYWVEWTEFGRTRREKVLATSPMTARTAANRTAPRSHAVNLYDAGGCLIAARNQANEWKPMRNGTRIDVFTAFGWNDFPSVKPPEGRPMRVETPDGDGMRLTWNGKYWLTSGGRIVSAETCRFRTWDEPDDLELTKTLAEKLKVLEKTAPIVRAAVENGLRFEADKVSQVTKLMDECALMLARTMLRR